MPTCPDCDRELGEPVAVRFKTMSRREFYACLCGTEPLLVGERKRDFELEDAEAAESWGPILWDLGALPDTTHPFAEAA